MSALPPDLQDFIERIKAGAPPLAPDPFGPGRPVTVARAPGRLDVMGGIADYSGSLVLQWPIREATRVAVQFQPASQILRIASVPPASTGQSSTANRQPSIGHTPVDVPLSLVTEARPPYAATREWFAERADRHWGAYVAGVFAVLAAERRVQFPHGATVLVESDVPEGKGVSSSAAIETATMVAVAGALRLSIPARDMALLCQRAENLLVGAPCGVMDQMTSMLGGAGELMALLCQPAELQGSIPLPGELGVWGIDSGIRHAVTGSDYASVRVGAFMGYRILADLAGLAVERSDRPGLVRIHDPRWRGYLANVGVDAFQELEPRIPVTIQGGAFLERYGGTTDPVTAIDAGRAYAVRTPTAHPVYEHARVTEWARLLGAPLPGVTANPAISWQAPPDADRSRPARLVAHEASLAASSPAPVAPGEELPVRLGTLMYHSHASYSACGLGSDGTELLVQLAREAGPEAGIYGAKITGGGSGGTVAVLGRAGAGNRVRRIAAEYESRTGRTARLFHGSSPGAASVGAVTLRIED